MGMGMKMGWEWAGDGDEDWMEMRMGIGTGIDLWLKKGICNCVLDNRDCSHMVAITNAHLFSACCCTKQCSQVSTLRPHISFFRWNLFV